MIRRRLQPLLFVPLILAAGSSVDQAQGSAAKPNVLLISIDDLNDWVGVLGGHPQAKTPNIDRLARRGVLFTNAHCQAPVCTPSRASLVTSRLPSSTGLYFLRPNLEASLVTKDAVTLAEQFAASGYETIGVGKIYGALDGQYFQTYGGRLGGFGPRPKNKLNHPMGHPLWDWGAYPESDADMPDSKIANWAARQLKRPHEKPLFLAVGFYRPHVPMYAPRKWFDMHPLGSIQLPKVLETDRDDLAQYAKDLTIGLPAPRHETIVQRGQWNHAVQSYLASSTFVDHCVGTVLDALDASGAGDNTIVVLFSDHGWHLGEKQRWAKRSLWEDSTRVPLVFSTPNLQPGRRCNRPVGLIDIYPTLSALCGLAPDPTHEGHSLVPLLENPHAPWDRPAITSFGPNNHAVRSTHWRYIRYSVGSEELYDHRSDPDEWDNLAGNPKYAEVIRDHAKWLPQVNLPAILDVSSAGLDAFLEAEKARKRRGDLVVDQHCDAEFKER